MTGGQSRGRMKIHWRVAVQLQPWRRPRVIESRESPRIDYVATYLSLFFFFCPHLSVLFPSTWISIGKWKPISFAFSLCPSSCRCTLSPQIFVTFSLTRYRECSKNDCVKEDKRRRKTTEIERVKRKKGKAANSRIE